MSYDIFKSKHDAGLKQETEAGAAAGATGTAAAQAAGLVLVG
jgi:hypothetical protein